MAHGCHFQVCHSHDQHGERQSQSSKAPHRVPPPPQYSSCSTKRDTGPKSVSPPDEPLPTKTDRHSPPLAHKPWLASCTVHNALLASTPTITLQLNGMPLSALLDSGSAIILAYPSVLPAAVRPRGSLVLTCVHGDMREVSATEVQVGS